MTVGVHCYGESQVGKGEGESCGGGGICYFKQRDQWHLSRDRKERVTCVSPGRVSMPKEQFVKTCKAGVCLVHLRKAGRQVRREQVVRWPLRSTLFHFSVAHVL